MQNTQLSDILTHYEAEKHIEALQVFTIEQYGSRKWYQQDEVLQKLNMQAHVNALMRADEFIMESSVTFDKVKMLIYDLIMSEMWKQYVLPHLKAHLNELPTMRSYVAIQHEAIVCNLIQVMFYHRTAVEAAETYLLEIIDYCYRKLAALVQKPPPKRIEKKTVDYYLKRTKEEEIEETIYNVNFQIQMMCLSIIRYVSDYINQPINKLQHSRYLPINIVHQLVVENDFLCLLVPLIEERPWYRQNAQGDREVFEQAKWVQLEKSQYSKLAKLEAQVWITIYNLFMDPESRRKYEFTDFKKSNLLRLRKYMNELLLDQIPNLVDMLRALEELQLMNSAPMGNSNPFIIQQMPELRQQICKDKKWKEIAQHQIETHFLLNDESIKEDMKKLAELYGGSVFEGLIEGYKCERCGKEAPKRCSKCKLVWYCTKECQVAHWKDHKLTCAQPQQQNAPQEQKKPVVIEQKAPLIVEEVKAVQTVKAVETVKVVEVVETLEANKIDFDGVD